MNFGGSPYELTSSKVKAVTGSLVASGLYTGDDSVNRAIPHGLNSVPKLIQIQSIGTTYYPHYIIDSGKIHYNNSAVGDEHAVTAVDATNFYVGNATSYAESANRVTHNYAWVVFA